MGVVLASGRLWGNPFFIICYKNIREPSSVVPGDGERDDVGTNNDEKIRAK